MKKSRIGAGTKAGHLSYLGDAVIGENTNIGAGTITCNYDGVNKDVTTIGSNVFIGSNTALVAPVSVGDGAYTASGSVITDDVPADAVAFGRARQENKPKAARRKAQGQGAGGKGRWRRRRGKADVRNRRDHRHGAGRAAPRRRAGERLELSNWAMIAPWRRWHAGTWLHRAAAGRRQARQSCDQARHGTARWQYRHWPHPLGDARRADRGQRPSTCDRQGRDRSQWHHREFPRAARGSGQGRLSAQDADRHGIGRALGDARDRSRSRPRNGGRPDAENPARRFRPSLHVQGARQAADCRPARRAAGRRLWRDRDVSGLGRHGAGAVHPRGWAICSMATGR